MNDIYEQWAEASLTHDSDLLPDDYEEEEEEQRYYDIRTYEQENGHRATQTTDDYEEEEQRYYDARTEAEDDDWWLSWPNPWDDPT